MKTINRCVVAKHKNLMNTSNVQIFKKIAFLGGSGAIAQVCGIEIVR